MTALSGRQDEDSLPDFPIDHSDTLGVDAQLGNQTTYVYSWSKLAEITVIGFDRYDFSNVGLHGRWIPRDMLHMLLCG